MSSEATGVAGRNAALERAREKARERRASGQSVVRLDPIQKAAAKPTSLRLAITAKCWSCVGAGADPHPRREIAECAVRRCPLHPVRPYQRGEEDES